ncbi:hypothetical protein JOF53_002269 [Crossiella equi]|uniref:Uncharacterized protein n=1 Tax=Crossiella equi TaxID=130796 RepID=A0ABS5AAS5_9PSEU|nr:hypothetical protein [Crossiella equi]MBP2473397.1 hypothetical protein [Crossiella equi]
MALDPDRHGDALLRWLYERGENNPGIADFLARHQLTAAEGVELVVHLVRAGWVRGGSAGQGPGARLTEAGLARVQAAGEAPKPWLVRGMRRIAGKLASAVGNAAVSNAQHFTRPTGREEDRDR